MPTTAQISEGSAGPCVRIELTDQCTEQQRGEEQAAAEAAAERDRRGQRLEQKQYRDRADRGLVGELVFKRAVAGGEHARGDQAQSAHDQATDRGAQPVGQMGAADHFFRQRDAAHHRDAEHGADQSQRQDRHVVDRCDPAGDRYLGAHAGALEQVDDPD
jgi:hypothetical protein